MERHGAVLHGAMLGIGLMWAAHVPAAALDFVAVGARESRADPSTGTVAVAVMQEGGQDHDGREMFFARLLATKLLGRRWQVYWAGTRQEQQSSLAMGRGEVVGKAARAETVSTVLDTKATRVLFVFASIPGPGSAGRYAARLLDTEHQVTLLSVAIEVREATDMLLESWAEELATRLDRAATIKELTAEDRRGRTLLGVPR